MIARYLIKVANSPRLLVMNALGMLAAFSFAYWLIEGVSPQMAIYWSVMTATTVGYGDVYPKTAPGKTLGVMLAVSMVIFFIPMVTASFASKLIVDRNAFTHDEQEELKSGIRDLITAIERRGDTVG